MVLGQHETDSSPGDQALEMKGIQVVMVGDPGSEGTKRGSHARWYVPRGVGATDLYIARTQRKRTFQMFLKEPLEPA